MDDSKIIELTDIFNWRQSPLMTCAGCPVILGTEFPNLAIDVAELPYITLASNEIEVFFWQQSKRFSACGANSGDDYAVLRKNPNTGWNYLVDKLVRNDIGDAFYH